MPQLRYGAVKKAAIIWARAKPQSHAKHFDQSCSSQWTTSLMASTMIAKRPRKDALALVLVHTFGLLQLVERFGPVVTVVNQHLAEPSHEGALYLANPSGA
eukprot:scaffold9623_cov67-Phaeocystis_antarctica.AAC.1